MAKLSLTTLPVCLSMTRSSVRGVAEALGRAAFEAALHGERIDGPADIVRDHQLEHLDDPRLDVHLDLGEARLEVGTVHDALVLAGRLMC